MPQSTRTFGRAHSAVVQIDGMRWHWRLWDGRGQVVAVGLPAPTYRDAAQQLARMLEAAHQAYATEQREVV